MLNNVVEIIGIAHGERICPAVVDLSNGSFVSAAFVHGDRFRRAILVLSFSKKRSAAVTLR
jgi:hypothetical protein